MRVLRPVSVALAAAVVLTGAISTGVILTGSPAVSAPDSPALTLAPDHGPPTAVFVAQYRVEPTGTQSGTRLGCPVVQFAFDGRALGAPQRSARHDGTACVASVRARPPARDRAPGPHRVAVAGTFGRTAAVATYTIQAAVSPTPAAGRATATHAAATAQDATEPAIFVPSTPADRIVPLDSAAPTLLAAPGFKKSGSAAPWIMVFGALLVLCGVGALGMLIYRGRRRRPDPHVDPDFGFDPDPGGFYD
jgi:hypothetical protein